MKLRLRYRSVTSVIEFANERRSFAALSLRVSEEFGLPAYENAEGIEPSWHLSLNGKDPLSAPQDADLADLDIVPGDLIVVLLPPNSSSTPQPEDVSNHFQSPPSKPLPETCNSSMSVTSINSSQSVHAMEHEASTSHPPDEPGPVVDSEVNRYLREPMLVRESTIGSIPNTVKITHDHAEPCNSHEAVCVLLHVMMVELGYCSYNSAASNTSLDAMKEPVSSESQTQSRVRPYSATNHVMPRGWRCPGAYKLPYQHPQCDATCIFTLIYVPLDTAAALHGSVSGGENKLKCQMKIKTTDFVQVSDDQLSYKGETLNRLSMMFKDTVAYPLLHGASSDDANPLLPCLTNLVMELKMMILQHLDSPTLLRLSETCQTLNYAAELPSLWRKLFLRDFGRRPNVNISQDWFKLYRGEYLNRKRMREERRHNVPPMFPPPIAPGFPNGPYIPPLGGVYPPGYIGGDYDRDPNYIGGLPGGVAIDPRPRPWFDPINPFPDQPLRPGRGRGIWESGSSHSRNRGRFGGYGGGPFRF